MTKSAERGILELADRTVTLHLVRMSRRKRWAIQVHSDHEVTVRAPASGSLHQAQALLHHHESWLRQRLARATVVPTIWQAGATLSYLGQSLTLALRDGQPGRGEIMDQVLHLGVLSSHPRDIAQALRHWYKLEARRLLPPRLRAWAKQLELPCLRITIRSQTSRWGSCSSHGYINLNWQLVLLPWETIDYVLVHELIHLRHMNHSPVFWQEVARHIPDYLQRRASLKKIDLKALTTQQGAAGC